MVIICSMILSPPPVIATLKTVAVAAVSPLESAIVDVKLHVIGFDYEVYPMVLPQTDKGKV